MRGFADEPSVEAIDRGLIHRVMNFGQVVAETPARSRHAWYVGCRIAPRSLPRSGPRPRSTAKFLECQSHRLDVLLPSIAHQTDQRARIDSAGKKCANRDIGHEMMAHAVEKRLPDANL